MAPKAMTTSNSHHFSKRLNFLAPKLLDDFLTNLALFLGSNDDQFDHGQFNFANKIVLGNIVSQFDEAVHLRSLKISNLIKFYN